MVSMCLGFLLAFFLPYISCAPVGLGDFLQSEGAALQQIGKDVNTAVNAFTNTTTQNALVNNQTCAAMTVIFARGTTEPGNVSVVMPQRSS